MADSKEAVPEKKKKAGKLPIILGIVLMLAGGGYFIKVRGSAKSGPPPLKLAAAPETLKEFLVNLRDGRTYIRTTISLHFKEGFTKEELDKNLSAIRDAINGRLRATALQELNSLDGTQNLKQGIAEAVNERLESLEGKQGNKKELDASATKPAKRLRPDWDSDKGPVLKVYFDDIATQ